MYTGALEEFMKNFNNEYEYLIHLIRCALRNQQPTEKPAILSFEKTYEYGKAHEVANIAFVSVQKLQNKPSGDLYTKWKTLYAFSIQRHYNQIMARDMIVDALNNYGIRNLELQGTVMKTLYPYPEWRMMSDIDFIIDKENLDAVENIVKELDYDTKRPNGFEVDAYGKNGIAVEFHSNFFDPKSICYGTITDAFSTATKIGNTYSYKSSDTIFYLYNLLHCIKHHLQRGAGIRRIMDIYVLRTNLYEKIDLKYIDDVLIKNGYKKIADELFSVAEKWFGDKISKIDVIKIEEQIYQSNNHGTTQVQFRNEYSRCSHKEKQFFKMRKYIALMFPSKQNIYCAYPLCEHKKYPIVSCWIYRWICALLNSKKRHNAIKLLSEIKKAQIK